MAFWHRYAYTDFHELDLDYLLKEMEIVKSEFGEASSRLSQAEDDIDAVEGRCTILETRMGTAENDIDAVEGRCTNLETRMGTAENDIDAVEGRCTALENAQIQDADMLSSVSTVTQDPTKIRVTFVKDDYTDGVKSVTSDYADLPTATNVNAGLLLPSDKAKLEKMTLSGNDIAFAGNVSSASAPLTSSDLTNKSYVDSLAITGSATVDTDSNILTTALSTNKSGATIASSSAIAKTYGHVNEVIISCRLTFSGSSIYLEDDDVLAYCKIKDAITPPAHAVFPCIGAIYRSSGGTTEYKPMIAFVGAGVGGAPSNLYFRWYGGHTEAIFTHLDIYMTGTYL